MVTSSETDVLCICPWLRCSFHMLLTNISFLSSFRIRIAHSHSNRCSNCVIDLMVTPDLLLAVIGLVCRRSYIQERFYSLDASGDLKQRYFEFRFTFLDCLVDPCFFRLASVSFFWFLWFVPSLR